MLNPQIDPKRLTRDDFEKHVDALQEAIAKHLDINTQKKGKLRDIAAKTLFGFDNGYQQALAHFMKPSPAIPLPTTRLKLPNEVTLLVPSDLTSYLVFGPSITRYGQREHGDFLHAVLDEYSEWSDEGEDEVNLVSDTGDYYNVTDLTRSQLVRQLHHDYTIHEMEVRMPRIDKYGISPNAYPDQAYQLLQELGLNLDGLEVMNVADLLVTTDDGDDGDRGILITLHKNTMIEARKACTSSLHEMIKVFDGSKDIPSGSIDEDLAERLKKARMQLTRMLHGHFNLDQEEAENVWATLSFIEPRLTKQIYPGHNRYYD